MYFLDCKLNVFNDACERGCWIVGYCTESGVWNERLVWALGFDFWRKRSGGLRLVREISICKIVSLHKLCWDR